MGFEVFLSSRSRLSALVLASLGLCVGSCKLPSTPHAKYQRQVPEDYRRMIEAARKNATHDELPAVLSDRRSHVYAPSPMKDISRATFGGNKQIAILDSSGPGVYLFGENGSYLGQLGLSGRGPGRYRNPWSVASTDNGFAIADFADHRVNIYRSDKSFISSFIYSLQRFSATGLLFDKNTHDFILFGDRPQFQREGDTKFSFVHVYDSDGHFLRSCYKMPDAWVKANYLAIDTPLLAQDTTNQYFMFPFDSTLHRLSSGASSVADLRLNLPKFQSPSTPLPHDGGGMGMVLSWGLTFTPIRSLALFKDEVFVEYESHQGLRYTIAQFHKSATTPIKVIETNYLLLGFSSDGTAIFADNPGDPEREINELTYGRFTF